MEKNYANIRDLAKEVFGTKRFRMTKKDDWMAVHSAGLVSRIIIEVDIANDGIYFSHIKDEKKVKTFEQQYQEKFLHGEKHTNLKFMKGRAYLKGSL